MLKQVQHDSNEGEDQQVGHSRKRVLLVPYASRSTSLALGNYRLQHDSNGAISSFFMVILSS